ncbi:uncharacterized protein F4822DRAFT_79220 [Hypoxylon trugodes]|uniref:uncharacterized protein n=1 Tax=Hypoxylon trugodes TaxID=326681 RepID=UPI00219F3F38|nr:uncharacterized protein F4822DRAFT_79220 [Hypoxylon trugodes]KAI1383486.1 hypothetical protein F4822DRAFT_79220 [Hypoxylon trugodes]
MYRISDHVASCLKLFRSTAINGLPNSSNEFVAFRITDEFARFKVWSSNIGAHRIGKSSLDYRLRDASHLQKQVENLLTDLSNSLKNALSILSGEKVPWDELLVEEEDYGQDVDGPTHGNVEFDTELDQILADITEVVDCLLRLSVSIRNPAPHDRLRASGRINVSHYETSDISHVATKFDSADPKLSECLGKANSRRRQYFRYRASHHGILSEGLDADFSKSEFEGQSTVASSIPQSQKGKVPNLRLNCIDEDELSDSGITQSSFATTRGDGGPHIPALPAKASKGPFECPFCYMMISVSSRRAWKKHIFADLRPYNCLVLDCPVVGIDFARRHQWMDHILQKHWRLWHCAFCSHPPFNSSESFQGHLQNSHGEIASNDQLIASLELSTNQRPLDNPSNCPLCQEPMSSTNEYKRHVGRHLEDIALFVLPTPDDDSGDENLEDLTSMDIDDSSTESSDSGAGEGEAVNALSETDNHSWMEIEVGREPVEDFFGYNTPIRPSTNLVEIGIILIFMANPRQSATAYTIANKIRTECLQDRSGSRSSRRIKND